ncbi:MAG: hypothetical protein M3T96_00745 [Acidobacteriota bacterium]|nr:hypothetical protein [Acidobacteriota bacterium]
MQCKKIACEKLELELKLIASRCFDKAYDVRAARHFQPFNDYLSFI